MGAPRGGTATTPARSATTWADEGGNLVRAIAGGLLLVEELARGIHVFVGGKNPFAAEQPVDLIHGDH